MKITEPVNLDDVLNKTGIIKNIALKMSDITCVTIDKFMTDGIHIERSYIPREEKENKIYEEKENKIDYEGNRIYEVFWWEEPLNFVVYMTLLVTLLVTVFAGVAWLFS